MHGIAALHPVDTALFSDTPICRHDPFLKPETVDLLPVPWYISSLPYKCLQQPHHIKLPKQPTHAPYKKGQTPHILPAPWRWFHLRQFLCFHSAGTFLRSVFFCCNGFPATEMLFHPCCFPPACFLPYPAIGLIRRIAIRRKTNASATNKSVETAIHP